MSGKRRLTTREARQLRLDRARGMTFRQLSRKYGISAPAAYYICRGPVSETRQGPYAEPRAQL